MKTIKNHPIHISIFFTMIFLINGCIAYKPTPVTIEEAAKTANNVRIEKTDGKKIRLLKVVKSDDGNYYGKKRAHGSVQQIFIDTEDIKKIQVKDKTKSTIRTIVGSVLIAVPLAITVGGIAGGGFY